MIRSGSYIWSNNVETTVHAQINIDGTGDCRIDSGFPLLDHFLFSFARYARYDLEIKVETDGIAHHAFEQAGIALGSALSKALGKRNNLVQFSLVALPMDEAVASIAVDINHSKGGLVFNGFNQLPFLPQTYDGVEVFCYLDLIEKLAVASKINVHVLGLHSDDIHHAIEILYKNVGFALYNASRIEANPIIRFNKNLHEDK